MLDRVHETYDSELAGKEFAYDGEKSLFTIGALPRNKHEFTVVLDNVTSNRYVSHSEALGGGGNFKPIFSVNISIWGVIDFGSNG